MKHKLEKLKEKLKEALLEVHELITEYNEQENVSVKGRIDPPPPDKPKG